MVCGCIACLFIIIRPGGDPEDSMGWLLKGWGIPPGIWAGEGYSSNKLIISWCILSWATWIGSLSM